MLKYCRVAVTLLILAPSAAQADWLFTPALAYPFEGDTVQQEHPAFGFALGLIDEESFAFEADFGYAPQFFEGNRSDFEGTGSVMTLMGNILVSPSRSAVLPYVTGGAGFMQMHVTSDFGTFETTTREAGFNVGGGILAFVRETVGIRGDVRYVRSFQNQAASWTRGVQADIAPGPFDFWRATFGVTFRVSE